VLLLSAPYRIARPALSTLEDAWQWIICEGKAGQIPAWGWTQDRQKVCLLPSAYENIDRATGTLRLSPSEVITNIELQVEALWRAGRWPPPNIQAVERGQWTVLEAVAWLVLRKLPKIKDGEWPIGLETSQIEPALQELDRARKQGLIGIQGLPDDEAAESFWLSPQRRPTKITYTAAEIMCVYPRLVSAAEWMDEVIEQYLTTSTAGADALIKLDANHADYTHHFIKLIASLGGSPDGLTPEEIAPALLASDLSVWVPEIQLTLHEMQEIKRRMADRLAKTTRASRLKAKRLGAAEPKTLPRPNGQVTLSGGANYPAYLRSAWRTPWVFAGSSSRFCQTA
jgi:hypothetical protein